MTFSLFASPARITPRTIAEPIFPTPMTPIFSFNITDLLMAFHCRQNKGSAQELQRLFGSVKMQRPSVCRRPSSVRYKENLVPFSNRFEGPPSIGVVGTKSEDFAILALSFP